MSKKPLLIVSRSTIFHNKSGGLETQLNSLVEYLKKYFNITILTTSKSLQKSSKTHLQNIEGVKYIFLKNTIPGEYGYSLFETYIWQVPVKKNKFAIKSNFKRRACNYYNKKLKGKYNIILSQSSSCQLFNITNEKLVAINHGTTINEIKSRFNGIKGLKDLIRFIGLNVPTLIFEHLVNNPKFFKKCKKIVLVSKSLKVDFCKHHKRFCKKALIIENGINIHKFSPSQGKYTAKDFKVFYAGRIDFEKGLSDFIDVADKFKDEKNIQFSIYGDGPDKNSLIEAIKKTNNKKLKYYGAITNSEMTKVMAESHIFLFLTKRKEGMPMSVIEALSSGSILLTTNNYLKDFGIVTTKQNLVKQIKKIKNQPDLLKKLSKKGRTLVVNNYSSEISGRKYLDLLQKIESTKK